MKKLEGYTILICDDEPEIVELLVDEFQWHGAKTLSASNGREGFQTLLSQKIHLVLSDIRMPGGDGVELLKKIKEKDPSIPIVFLATGFSDYTEEEVCALGAEAVFKKPFQMAKMVETVTTRLLQVQAH